MAKPARMQPRRPQDCLRHGSGALRLSPGEVAAAHYRPRQIRVLHRIAHAVLARQ